MLKEVLKKKKNQDLLEYKGEALSSLSSKRSECSQMWEITLPLSMLGQNNAL